MSPHNQRIFGMALVGIIKGIALVVMVATTLLYLVRKNFENFITALHRKSDSFRTRRLQH